MNKELITRIIIAFIIILFSGLAFAGNLPDFAKPMDIEPELLSRDYRDPYTGMEFMYVKGGCFEMGDTFGDGFEDERPVHTVCVKGFYIGKFEVTQGQWEKVMGSNPSNFKNGDNYPVEQVSWNDVQGFIQKLNQKTGKNYRLSTEAEWEYAARSGGKREKYAGTSNESLLYQYANFCDVNCDTNWKTSSQDDGYKNTSPVGRYKPNGLGIYDMTGNVWEWCLDWHGKDYYDRSPKDNPKGPNSGKYKVIRGGSWDYVQRYLRTSNRDWFRPEGRGDTIGFRLVRPE